MHDDLTPAEEKQLAELIHEAGESARARKRAIMAAHLAKIQAIFAVKNANE